MSTVAAETLTIKCKEREADYIEIARARIRHAQEAREGLLL